ncbi:MAG TPA: helical backbone metal receptor [Bryobacteraceae bacterium]|nr:helical backbone metal receptor [Bryobacteraceae bacterium]
MRQNIVPFVPFLIAAIAFAAPRRVVSTAPAITETLFAVGAGPTVVGVTNYCHYPPQAARIRKIGTYLQPHTETILALQPDLVITEDSPLHTRDQFTAMRLNVLRVRFETIADVYQSIRAIGGATGRSARAEVVIAGIRSDLEAVRTRVAGRPAVPLMFIVGRTPNTLEGIVATGNAPYMNEVMQIAGGRNVFRDAAARYFRVSREEIIARDPAVILDMGDMADTKAVTEEHRRSVEVLWRREMPILSAVRNGRVHAIASDIFVVTGPRVAECAQAFARMLHPEVFR